MLAFDVIMTISFSIAIILGSLTFYHIKNADKISSVAHNLQWKLFIAVCAQVRESESSVKMEISDLRPYSIRVHSLLLYHQLPVLRNSSLLRWRCLDENDCLLPCLGCSHHHSTHQWLQVILSRLHPTLSPSAGMALWVYSVRRRRYRLKWHGRPYRRSLPRPSIQALSLKICPDPIECSWTESVAISPFSSKTIFKFSHKYLTPILDIYMVPCYISAKL